MRRGRALGRSLVCACALAAGAAAQAQTPAQTPAQTLAHPGAEDGLRAQITAPRLVVLSAAMAGTLTAFPYREGDKVAADAVVAAVDCSTQAAQKRVAQAKLGGAGAKAKVNERLEGLHAVSVLDVQMSRAEAGVASAEIGHIDALLKKCEVKAPFAGVVTARMVHPHQHVKEGEALLELIDPSQLEVELVAPARWLKWLTIGAPFELRLEDLDRNVGATVSRIIGKVDPIAQTVRVIGVLTPSPTNTPAGLAPVGLAPGMSALVRFPTAPGP